MTVPAASASISFMIFIASMMQIGSPSLTTLPTSTNGVGARARRAVEGADHRRLDDVAGRRRRSGASARQPRSDGGAWCGEGCMPAPALAGGAACRIGLDDADLAVGFGDLELGDVRFRDEVDQGLQLAKVHPKAPVREEALPRCGRTEAAHSRRIEERRCRRFGREIGATQRVDRTQLGAGARRRRAPR